MRHRGAIGVRFVVAVLLAWASTACGSGGKEAARDSTSTTAPAAAAGGSADATGTSPGGASSPTSSAPSTGPAPGAPGSGAAGGGGSAPSGGPGQAAIATPTIDARVDRACVRPGEEQTLTVSRALPDDYVVYDTEYADGKSGLTTTYGSGHGSGRTDATGTFRTTWRLAPDVPAGRAKVNTAAATASGTATATAEFVIVAAQQTCP